MREPEMTEMSEINGGRSIKASAFVDEVIQLEPIYELPVVKPVYYVA